MTHVYSLKTLELGVHVFPEPGSSLQVLGEGPSWNFWLLVATVSPRCPWLVAASLLSLLPSSRGFIPLFVLSDLSPLIRTLVTAFGPSLIHRDLNLTLLHLQDLFPDKVTPRKQGLRLQHKKDTPTHRYTFSRDQSGHQPWDNQEDVASLLGCSYQWSMNSKPSWRSWYSHSQVIHKKGLSHSKVSGHGN